MYTVFFTSVEELNRFMQVARLQNPTRRMKGKEEPTQAVIINSETVKQEADGTVTVSKMEILPTSSGRERFGSGTKNWSKFPVDSPALERFSR